MIDVDAVALDPEADREDEEPFPSPFRSPVTLDVVMDDVVMEARVEVVFSTEVVGEDADDVVDDVSATTVACSPTGGSALSPVPQPSEPRPAAAIPTSVHNQPRCAIADSVEPLSRGPSYGDGMTLDDLLLNDAVGNTPLVPLTKLVPEGYGQVFVKLESGNPTGSYKDRMAVAVVRGAIERGDVSPGDRLVEYTGGSTGTALAFVCARVGLRFCAVSSDAFSEVKLRSMVALGAEVVVEPSHGNGITPELIARMRNRASALAAEDGSHYADQFGSPDVRSGYTSMGTEIARQTGGRVDVLCAGVGTGGALMGTVDGLDAAGLSVDVVALEPKQSPLLTTGFGGAHRVEGVGIGFEPPFIDRNRIGEIRTVDESDAFAMARALAREEGLLCGTSTGMNVRAAIDLAGELGPEAVVVTLGCDNGAKYLAGIPFATS